MRGRVEWGDQGWEGGERGDDGGEVVFVQVLVSVSGFAGPYAGRAGGPNGGEEVGPYRGGFARESSAAEYAVGGEGRGGEGAEEPCLGKLVGDRG